MILRDNFGIDRKRSGVGFDTDLIGRRGTMQSEQTTSRISRRALAALAKYNDAKNLERREKCEHTLSLAEELDGIIFQTCGDASYTVYTTYTLHTQQKQLFSLDDESHASSNSTDGKASV
jgi:hypothetical protein